MFWIILEILFFILKIKYQKNLRINSCHILGLIKILNWAKAGMIRVLKKSRSYRSQIKIIWLKLDKISSPIRFLYLTLVSGELNDWLEDYKNDHEELLLQVLDSGKDGDILGPAFKWNLTAGEIFLEAQGFQNDSACWYIKPGWLT